MHRGHARASTRSRACECPASRGIRGTRTPGHWRGVLNSASAWLRYSRRIGSRETEVRGTSSLRVFFIRDSKKGNGARASDVSSERAESQIHEIRLDSSIFRAILHSNLTLVREQPLSRSPCLALYVNRIFNSMNHANAARAIGGNFRIKRVLVEASFTRA